MGFRRRKTHTEHTMKLFASFVLTAARAQLIPDLFEQYANEIISPDVDGYEINPEYLYDLPTVSPPDVNDTDIDLEQFGRTMQSASRLRPYQNQNNNNYQNNQNNQNTNANKNTFNTNKVNNNKNSFFNKYNNYKGNKNKKTTTPEPTTTTTTSTSIYTTTTTTTSTTTVWSTTTSPVQNENYDADALMNNFMIGSATNQLQNNPTGNRPNGAAFNVYGNASNNQINSQNGGNQRPGAGKWGQFANGGSPQQQQVQQQYQQQKYPQQGPLNQPSGLTCWKCHARSFDECERRGRQERCSFSQQSCELEIRERRGRIEQIQMGCKQHLACENNKRQNFVGRIPAWTQCRPESGYEHSVCRQCCTEDQCTKLPNWWYPQSREEWAYG